jgi:hypothetical protein
LATKHDLHRLARDCAAQMAKVFTVNETEDVLDQARANAQAVSIRPATKKCSDLGRAAPGLFQHLQRDKERQANPAYFANNFSGTPSSALAGGLMPSD